MENQDTLRLLRECDAGAKMGVASIDGVKSLSRYLNQYPNAQPQAQKITRELIGEEESLAKAVRPYL